MPLVFYRPNNPPCRLCGEGFERWEKNSNDRLEQCEKCGQGVTRLLPTAVNTPKASKPVSVSDAKASGFTVLKKISSGEYEKQ